MSLQKVFAAAKLARPVSEVLRTRPVGSLSLAGHVRTFHCMKSQAVVPVGALLNHDVSTKRYYKKKLTLKKPPTKVLDFTFAGDETDKLPPLDDLEVRPGFEDVVELLEQDENVKKIFSIGFSDGTQKRDKIITKVVDQIRDHPTDLQSLEVTIARQTVQIRNLIKNSLKFRKNKLHKTFLYNTINSRRSNLAKLKKLDKDKFDWLCRELKVELMPHPGKKLSKREVREQAARDVADKLRREKYEVFKSKLEEQRQEFEIHKQNEIEEIAKEMESIGLKMSDSLDETLVSLGDKPYTLPPPKPRRQQLLELKFEMYKEGPPRYARKRELQAAAAAAAKK